MREGAEQVPAPVTSDTADAPLQGTVHFLPTAEQAPAPPADVVFPIGARVRHGAQVGAGRYSARGMGTVIAHEPGKRDGKGKPQGIAHRVRFDGDGDRVDHGEEHVYQQNSIHKLKMVDGASTRGRGAWKRVGQQQEVSAVASRSLLERFKAHQAQVCHLRRRSAAPPITAHPPPPDLTPSGPASSTT